MQFKTLCSIVALVGAANAAALADTANSVTLEKRAASLVWFSGNGCTDTVIATDSDTPSGECLFLRNGVSARSILFSDVPNQILFFIAVGGTHDPCNFGPKLNATGSGCATAPAG